MSLPQSIRHHFFLLLVVLLNSCTDFNTPPPESTSLPQSATNVEPVVDKLLDFGVGMSAMSEPSRTDLCKSLLNTQQLLYSDDVQLQLMIGRLLSDACGDIPKILEGIETINSDYKADERLQKLITIHSQALLHIHNRTKKPLAIKQKSKKLKSVPEIKEVAPEIKEATDTKPNETHLLREKLEAIRSMEKQLDESIESN